MKKSEGEIIVECMLSEYEYKSEVERKYCASSVERIAKKYHKMMLDNLTSSSRIIGRTPPTDEQREPIENAFYATGTMSPEAATELTTDILQYLSDAKLKIVYER
jgi:hypothetical protein